jgi:hypothetical protein
MGYIVGFQKRPTNFTLDCSNPPWDCVAWPNDRTWTLGNVFVYPIVQYPVYPGLTTPSVVSSGNPALAGTTPPAWDIVPPAGYGNCVAAVIDGPTADRFPNLPDGSEDIDLPLPAGVSIVPWQWMWYGAVPEGRRVPVTENVAAQSPHTAVAPMLARIAGAPTRPATAIRMRTVSPRTSGKRVRYHLDAFSTLITNARVGRIVRGRFVVVKHGPQKIQPNTSWLWAGVDNHGRRVRDGAYQFRWTAHNANHALQRRQTVRA